MLMAVNRRLLRTVAGALGQAFDLRMCDYGLRNSSPKTSDPQDATERMTKALPMLRLTTFRLTSDGRILGFDTGDWSMLLGGFVLAGLLSLFV